MSNHSRNHSHRCRLWFTAASAASVLVASSALAVVAPYTIDFTTTSSVDDFNENTDAQWSLTSAFSPAVQVYQNHITTGDTPSSALLEVTNLGGVNFTMSTMFAIEASASGGNFIGFAALSGANTATTGGYLADVTQAGNMRIFKLGASQMGETVSFGGPLVINPTTPTWYTMTLSGVYASGQLALEFTLTDGTTTQSFTRTDTGTLKTGSYFGLRNRAIPSGNPLQIAYSDFSIIPEPAPVALLAFGALALTFSLHRSGKLQPGQR